MGNRHKRVQQPSTQPEKQHGQCDNETRALARELSRINESIEKIRCDQTASQENSNKLEGRRHSFEQFTIGGIIVTALITAWQGYTFRQQLEETRNADRASLSIRDIALTQAGQGNDRQYYLSPIWENSGTTPTSEMTMSIAATLVPKEAGLKSGFTRCRAPTPAPRISVGPKAQSQVNVFPIFPGELSLFQADTHHQHYYIWGRSNYRDVFGGRHSTRFCWNVAAISGNPEDPASQPRFVQRLCDEGNCIDDECDADDRKKLEISYSNDDCNNMIRMTNGDQGPASLFVTMERN